MTVHDVDALLNGSPAQVNDIKAQIRGAAVLRGRSVGLAFVYAGAPSDSDIPQAQEVAVKIYGILSSLGREDFAFERASYYSPEFILGEPLNNVQIDVYLLAR